VLNAPSARPLIAAAATGVLVGAAVVATRSVIDVAGPASLAFLRYAIGAAVLVPVALLGRRPSIPGRDLLPIAVLGIGQFGILVLLLNWSLETITAGRAALLFATMPLMTLVLAVTLRREPFAGTRLAGVMAAIGGVGLALSEEILPAPGSGATDPSWAGHGAALGSALVGAVCSVAYRPYLERHPTLPVSAVAMVAAVSFLLIPALGEAPAGRPPAMGMGEWATVAFIGLSSAIGYVCWLWALGHASATRVTVFLALSPVTAVLLETVILGEPITTGVPAGAALVGFGLWLANRPVGVKHRCATDDASSQR
jgi:drug/metabolite transporter (DMT)-like permease